MGLGTLTQIILMKKNIKKFNKTLGWIKKRPLAVSLTAAVLATVVVLVFLANIHAQLTWQIETVDSAGNTVGSSLKLDSSNKPHISYRDITSGNLKYAEWNGLSWDIQAVDSIDYVEGGYPSFALDSNNYPHISYVGNNNLKYAEWNGTSWEIETVDTGSKGRFSSLALDSNNYPHVSYQDSYNNDLKYAKWNGTSWGTEIVDSAGYVGQYTSLALDSSNYPHISYRDANNGNLKYAKWNGSSWDIETVDSVGWSDGYTSLALDSSNNPHISYLDNTNSNLKYAKWNGSSWEIETVDSAGNVGGYTSLALDSSGYAHISYRGSLKYAHQVEGLPFSPSPSPATGTPTPAPTIAKTFTPTPTFTPTLTPTSADAIPPETLFSFTVPVQQPDLSWLTTITLSATDIGSGVNLTKYSTDNLNFSNYVAPFELSVPNSDAGITVYYYSIDFAGNSELTNSQKISAYFVQQTIQPSGQSTTISNPSEEVVIVLPPSGNSYTVTITKTDATQGNYRVGTTYGAGGSVYYYNINIDPPQTFASPGAFVTFTYPDNLVGNENKMGIYKFNPATNKWVPVSWMLDKTTQTVSFYTISFSDYAIVLLDDDDNDGIANYFDNCSTAGSYFEGCSSAIEVEALEHRLAYTTNKNQPTSQKVPLPNLPIKVFKKSDVMAKYSQMSPANYADVWNTLTPIHGERAIVTGSDGKVKIGGDASAEYLVLGNYNGTIDVQLSAKPSTQSSKISSAKLTLLTVPQDAKAYAGQVTRVSGSGYLDIYEPEYVSLSGSFEYYPYVFEAFDNWDVTVTVTAPEGWTTDVEKQSLTIPPEQIKSANFMLLAPVSASSNGLVGKAQAAENIKTLGTVKSAVQYSIKDSAKIHTHENVAQIVQVPTPTPIPTSIPTTTPTASEIPLWQWVTLFALALAILVISIWIWVRRKS